MLRYFIIKSYEKNYINYQFIIDTIIVIEQRIQYNDRAMDIIIMMSHDYMICLVVSVEDICRDYHINCSYACHVINNGTTPECYCGVGAELSSDGQTCYGWLLVSLLVSFKLLSVLQKEIEFSQICFKNIQIFKFFQACFGNNF